MNKTIIGVYTVLILSSCQKTTGTEDLNQIDSTISDSTIQSLDQQNEKHTTLNEIVESADSNLKSFIPAGYSTIFISSGDLNHDEYPDKILVLRKDTEEETSDYSSGNPDKRPLLILLGQSNDSFKLQFRNDNAVYCIDCGGLFGIPSPA